MKKVNAFIFIFFYLLMTKMVFASSVVIDGKSYDCKNTGYVKHECVVGNKKIFVVGFETGDYVALTKDSNGILGLKGVSKVVEDDKVVYQVANQAPLYEDTNHNRMLAADLVLGTLEYDKDPIAREMVENAKKSRTASRENKSKLNLTALGENYQCTIGTTRAYTAREISMQAQYKAKFVCPFYSCTGKNPNQKVLMLLPKAGGTMTPTNVVVMEHSGHVRFVDEDFKVTDETSVPVISIKNKTKRIDDNYNDGPISTDLLVPSKISNNPEAYRYLLDIAKKSPSITELIGLCDGDKTIAPLFAEQQKAADNVQRLLAEQEIVEYLKIVDNKIQSYYVDRTKGERLGCYYQDKIIDKSVMERFERLQKISTLKSTDKYLSPSEVQELFNKAKNMKDIPFGYKYDGCYARAHLMARRFEAMGIPTQKAWIKGTLSVPNTDIAWDYHVAPTVQVKEKDGKIFNYVIDPSLTDKAVTLDAWVASMASKAKGPLMKTVYPFPSNGIDFDRTAVALSNTDNYGPNDLEGMTEADKMDLSTRTLKRFSEIIARQ